MKTLFTLISLLSTLTISLDGIAQCEEPFPPPANTCSAAQYSPLVGICTDLYQEFIQSYPGFCGGSTIINNPQYYLFVANAEVVLIEIEIDSCFGGQFSMQSAVIKYDEDCDDWTSDDVIVCHPGAPVTATMSLNFVSSIGETYVLLLDGSAGSYCGYEIVTADGVGCPDISASLQSVDGDAILCQGAAGYTATATGIFQGDVQIAWNFPWLDDPVYTDDSVVTFDIPFSFEGGQYTICAQALNGCDSLSNELCYSIGILETDPLIISGPGSSCFLMSDTLMVTQNFEQYQWSTSADDTTNFIVVDYPGDYTVTVTSENGCQQVSTATVNQIGDVPEILGQELLCNGESATLSVDTSAVSYLWSTGDTSQSIQVSEAGEYCVTISYADCNHIVCKSLQAPQALATLDDPMQDYYCLAEIDSFNISFAGDPPFELTIFVENDSSRIEVSEEGTFTFNFPASSGQAGVIFHGNNQCPVEEVIWTGEIDQANLEIVDFSITEIGNSMLYNIVIDVDGGLGIYEFDLTGVEINETGIFTEVPPGSYCLSVTSGESSCFVDTCFTFGFSSTEDINKPHLLVYPNPARESLFIHVPFAGPGELRIYDVQGRLVVASSEVESGSVPISSLNQGLYFIELGNSENGAKYYAKFIKE